MSNSSKKARNFAALSGGALVAAAPFVVSGTAHAGTTTVTSKNDSGPGSLREAIENANANPDADVITFAPSVTGTIVLTESLNLYTSIDIQGPGASVLTIDADGTGKVFYTRDSSDQAEISISGLTITGGDVGSYAGGISSWGDDVTLENLVITGNSGSAAGAVYFDGGYDEDTGTLTIRNTTISGNDGSGSSGGIYILRGGDGETSALVIESSTVSGNTGAGWGGGLYIANGVVGEVLITNSTFSGNTAEHGGAIATDDTGYSDLTIRNTTISGNTATCAGGGLYIGSSANTDVSILNSIVANNVAAGTCDATVNGTDIYSPNEADLSVNYSLIEDPAGFSMAAGTGNVTGTDPMLGALADNGGATETHLPQAGSPVIDAGDPAYTAPPSTDQRGRARVYGSHIDMGAVEVQPAALPPTGGSNSLMAGLGAALLGLGGALHLTGRRKRSA